MIEAKDLEILEFIESDKLDCIERVKLRQGRTYRDLERVEFWERPQTEEMGHRTIGEAVEDFEHLCPDFHVAFLTLHGYVRLEISLPAGDTLERVLEWLDEEYGDPDGGSCINDPRNLVYY